MPRDTEPLAEAQGIGNRQIRALFARLSDDSRESFTEAQRKALVDAADGLIWNRHPVNLRLSVPLLFNRYYLTIVGGRERRGGERRAIDRRENPIATVGNWVFLAAVGTVIGLAALAAIQFVTLSALQMSGAVVVP